MNNQNSKTAIHFFLYLIVDIIALCLPVMAVVAFMMLTGVSMLLMELFLTAVSAGILLLSANQAKLIPRDRRKKINWTIIFLVTGILVLWWGSSNLERILFEVTEQELDLAEYEPHRQGTKAVVLKEASSLTMIENLPRMDGATALYPVYAAFAQAVYPQGDYSIEDAEGLYRAENIVKCNGTTSAYWNLIRGDADVIFVAGPSDEELQMAREEGKELILTPIGREGFVFFVNRRNSVDNLSLDQIRGIYAGEITNWKEVGGSDEKIRPFQRPKNSGSQTALENLMAEKPLMVPEHDDVVDAMSGIISKAASYKNFRNSLGYSFHYFATQMVQDKGIRLLKVNGVEPNAQTIQEGSYPLTSEFYAVTTTRDNPYLNQLLDWILSPQGQEIILKTGYAPI